VGFSRQGNGSVHEIVTFSACNGLSAVLADSRSVIGAARAGEASFCFKPRSGTGQAGRASGQTWGLGSLAAWHRLTQRKAGATLPEMIRIIGVDD
jgi:hypothetical protein